MIRVTLDADENDECLYDVVSLREMQSSGEQDVASPSGAIMDVAYRADDERILSPSEFATARVRRFR